MYYTAELSFFRRFLEKMRIQSHIVQNQNISAEKIDMGLRKSLGREQEYMEAIRQLPVTFEENTVYRMIDSYACNYLFFILPQTDAQSALVLGPYLSRELRTENLLQQAERQNVSAADCRRLERFYGGIPLLPDDTALMMVLTTLAESMWGTGSAYKILDLQLDRDISSVAPPEYTRGENTKVQMEMMQRRYDYENELMDNVSKGLWHRARLMLSSLTNLQGEQRLTDLLRNQKNYCIICNTLLRKAAEKGGVHPFHLDRISSQFARQIELVMSVRDGQNLIVEMVQSYCRLVRRHSLQDYSPLIQKVIIDIDADISSDLRLTNLAKRHNVSPEYLSSLFHKEVGKTLTQFVNEKRLELGAELLRTSSLQVQTIAEYCGFPDAGYFAKLFKKRYGVPPKAFRDGNDGDSL